MTYILRFLDAICAPFTHPVSPDGVLYWPYLVGFVLFGAAVWMVQPKHAERRRNLLSYLFPPELYRTASAQLDLRYFIVNTFLYTLLIVPLTLTSGSVARVALTAMIDMFGVPEFSLPSGPAAAVIAAAAIVVAADFGFFIAHYLQHKVPALWAFHKAHHAAEVLHPLTAFRSHPVDLVLDFTLMGTMSGLAMAVLAYVFDSNLTVTTLLGANAFTFAFHVTGSHLRHSHIWLDYGSRLSAILVSPAMHQLHHSTADAYRDKNLGGILAIWDALFGTLYVPRAREALSLGLMRGESRRFRTVLDLYLHPFTETAAMFSGETAPSKNASGNTRVGGISTDV